MGQFNLFIVTVTNTEVFLHCDYAGKADFNTGYWNPDRKLKL